ncbi:MAG: hypothetical protein M3460_05375 [Actinomycetota bacterium]|nr:hypothetical protein [Actinomycetota bacterium]
MSDALSFAEIDGQHVELLPARTVLSMFATGGPRGGDAGNGGMGGTGGEGGDAKGKAALFDNWFYTEGDVYNYVTGATGGTGGAADGGATTGGAGVDD